jgi:hypothetical protein
MGSMREGAFGRLHSHIFDITITASASPVEGKGRLAGASILERGLQPDD